MKHRPSTRQDRDEVKLARAANRNRTDAGKHRPERVPSVVRRLSLAFVLFGGVR